MEGQLKLKMDLKPLRRLQKKSPIELNKAMKKGAIQFLNWSNNGSMKCSKKPPIRWGVLRGSSSAFVGNELVLCFPINIKAGADESPTPVKSYNGKATLMTWIWNTDYAKKMHEWSGGWGEFTIQDTDAGNKWLEEHLKADKQDLMDLIEKDFFKGIGLS